MQLLCSVRGCSLPLAMTARTLACATGHSFDRARAGYWNLLQPQDRRSRTPGDSEAIVAARARALDCGWATALITAIVDAATELTPDPAAALLDIGCGSGHLLAALHAAGRRTLAAVELSVAAARNASRRAPDALLIVANADRGLPFADASIDLAFSIDARRPASEIARTLRAGGGLLVGVPADDDLAELREHTMGQVEPRERGEVIARELSPQFEPSWERRVRASLTLDRERLGDLLIATYRGRRQLGARLETIDILTITTSHLLSYWVPRHDR